MPSTITTPSRTEMLSVLPVAYRMASPPASENGMPSATRSATRVPRKSQHTASTDARPSAALDSMMRIASRVGMVWSSVNASLMPERSSSGFFSAMKPRMRSTSSSVLV